MGSLHLTYDALQVRLNPKSVIKNLIYSTIELYHLSCKSHLALRSISNTPLFTEIDHGK